MHLFALVDCNNFFVSCERIFRPDLNGKPVVVLSSNDGCVIARSNEAKALGIPMGAPAYQYKELFDKHSVKLFSCNFTLYGDISGRIMKILSSYSSDYEMYSIDEAFIDFSGISSDTDIVALGHRIRSQILKWVGVPVSVGFAHTKALAKVATHVAKKFTEHTGGVYFIDTEQQRVKALRWMPVSEVWGIGRRHSARLESMGVSSAYDFISLSDSFVRKTMSVIGWRLKMELSGHSVLDIEDVGTHKNITISRTFEHPIYDFDSLRERITTFSVAAAEKLRKQGSMARNIMVYIRTNKHNSNSEQYTASTIVRFDYDTNSNIDIVKYAVSGLKDIYRSGYGIKKAGIMLMDFSEERAHQLSLFDNRDPRHIKLMKTVDKINASYGQQSIRLASQDGGLRWKLKQDNLSPNYTTDLKDIIVVNSE